MHQTSSSRLVAAGGLALAGLLAGCASPGGNLAWADKTGLDVGPLLAPASVPLVPQGDIPEPDQVHPRTMITLGFGLGDQTNEVNTGNFTNQVITSSASSYRFRLRGEHFFESGFGVFGEAFTGMADDINEDLGSADSSMDSTGVFIAAAFRATLDDDFRLPVRLGAFLQKSEVEDVNFTDGTIERSTIGVRLSAEPEYIVFQTHRNGKTSELSVYGEIRAGAGPSNVEDNVDKEDGYAFTLDYEAGVRYRFGFGLLASLSYVASKYHIGTTESYNNAVFFGVDDDFNGIMFTAGFRH